MTYSDVHPMVFIHRSPPKTKGARDLPHCRQVLLICPSTSRRDRHGWVGSTINRGQSGWATNRRRARVVYHHGLCTNWGGGRCNFVLGASRFHGFGDVGPSGDVRGWASTWTRGIYTIIRCAGHPEEDEGIQGGVGTAGAQADPSQLLSVQDSEYSDVDRRCDEGHSGSTVNRLMRRTQTRQKVTNARVRRATRRSPSLRNLL